MVQQHVSEEAGVADSLGFPLGPTERQNKGKMCSHVCSCSARSRCCRHWYCDQALRLCIILQHGFVVNSSGHNLRTCLTMPWAIMVLTPMPALPAPSTTMCCSVQSNANLHVFGCATDIIDHACLGLSLLYKDFRQALLTCLTMP